MGFSIGGFLGTIAPAVLGSILGPVGSVIGRGIAGGLRGDPITGRVGTVSAPTERSSGSQFGPTSVQMRLPVPRGGPFPGGPRGRTPIPIPVPDLFGNGGRREWCPAPTTRLGQILDRARANTEGAASTKKIRDAVRGCGLDIAASMFGLSVEDVCFVFIQRRRRRGGISATDLRRTRSTIRKINNMRKSLKTLRSR